MNRVHRTSGSTHRAARGRTLSAVALVTVASLGLAACGGSSDSADSGSGATKAADGAYPVTIDTAMGKVTIDKRPVRVAALDTSYVDAAIALKAEVVAYPAYRTYGQHGLPDYLGADGKTYSKGAVDTGELMTPNLGKLAATKPDLIVSAKVRHEKYYNQFEKIAPTVFSETTGPTWKQNLLMLGKVLDKETLAKERIATYEKRAKKIGEEIKEKNKGTMPTVSVVRFAGEPTVRLYTEASFPGQVMDDIGFERPKGQPTTKDGINVDISQERIRSLDADYLFVSTFDDPTGAAQKASKQFETNPLWKKLTGKRTSVSDLTWFSSVSVQGAETMLDDVAKTFGVDPARD
ncbi:MULTISPECIES: ABC transporter substrate-binding protein [unclassified Streptomyces]|uniref:ABC transporter substrate-binding protein n=1 Tax=unclassified Streptomyces TaxID=2593676 RepID=UPI00382428F1